MHDGFRGFFDLPNVPFVRWVIRPEVDLLREVEVCFFHQDIFGEIDVPRLDEDRSLPAPFDVSRSMRLNVSNELVQALYSFIGQKVEETRRVLLEAEKRRKADEETKRLEEQADEIANIINQDFDVFRQRLARARAKASGSTDLNLAGVGAESGEEIVFGSDILADVIPPVDSKSKRVTKDVICGPPREPIVTPGSPESEKMGRQAGNGKRKPQARGGFQVRFENMGEEAHRAKYVSDERTIYINLDHPQLTAARGIGSIEDPIFRRLAYEIAFSEYAIALASELIDEYLDPSDPIVDIRETLNRVARRGAGLYSK